MPKIIRVGDPTSHGGKVLASSVPHSTVDGIAVAVVGDPCSCPKRGHSGCTIAEGHPTHKIDGKAVAYEGHKTTCGATLQASGNSFSAG
jgi:uncharacterized Zn-binding protein involved in type VI secretion